jgi:hypothetical protein
MIRKVHIFLSILLIAPSASVSARNFSGKIIDLVAWSDGHAAISIENAPDNGCTQLKYYSLGVKGQDIKAEPMLSIALTAYIGGHPVQISTFDGMCQGGQEKIHQLRLLQ